MKHQSHPTDPGDCSAMIRQHFRFGWWTLGAFVLLGLLLEALHGFKAGLYLNVANETRRLMWTLAHAHGTLLSLVNLMFAMTLPRMSASTTDRRRWASHCLTLATLLVPGGFFLGGMQLYGGDPGLGVVLVPAGALSLLIGILLTASAIGTEGPRPTAGRK